VHGSAAEKAATVNSSSSLSESDVSYTDGALGDVLDFLAKPLLTSKRRGDGETVSGFALSEWVVTTLCVSTRDATVSYLAFMVYGLWFMVYGFWTTNPHARVSKTAGFSFGASSSSRGKYFPFTTFP
jgi:hypothetical protein